MDGQRPRARPRPEPVADPLPAEEQRAASAALVGGPLAFGGERAVRDADAREVEHGSEVKRETGAARVVATRRVDQEQVRQVWEGSDGGLEKRALAKREEARFVWRSRMTRQG